MVRRFRKRRRGGRRGGRFSRFMGGASKAIGVAGKALRVARQVKDLLNVEFKSYTDMSTYAAYPIPSAAVSISWLLPIVEGTGDDERNGTSVKASSLFMDGQIHWTAASTRAQTVRMVVLKDKHGDGTNDPSWSIGGANDVFNALTVNAMRNLQTTDRFEILSDKRYYLSDQHPIAKVKIYKKLDTRMEFNGNTATNASSGNNSIWVLTLSDQVVANYPQMTVGWRMRYIDN